MRRNIHIYISDINIYPEYIRTSNKSIKIKENQWAKKLGQAPEKNKIYKWLIANKHENDGQYHYSSEKCQ